MQTFKLEIDWVVNNYTTAQILNYRKKTAVKTVKKRTSKKEQVAKDTTKTA